MPYKVVSSTQPDKLLSACAWGKFECQYSTKEWTTAPVGGLLCFEDYYAACLFCAAEKREDLEIWECLGESPVKLGLWNLTDPANAWQYDSAHLSQGRDHWWPDGTIAYKRVKLLNKLHTPMLKAC